jgi:hypothetical protein
MIVDNFALSMFQTCPAKYHLRIKQGWTPRRKSSALGFGGAVHEGLAQWYKTGSIGAALQGIKEKWPNAMPTDDYRSLAKALEVVHDYTKKYPTESFSIVGLPDNAFIEKSFTIDTGLFLPCLQCDEKPPANSEGTCAKCNGELEPLLYGGIFDGLVEFSGKLYVLEHKTTSQMGSRYFHQFRPNNQVSGYVWGAQKMSGSRVGGAIINAIGVYKASATKFERQITTRTDAEIDEWLENVYRSAAMIQHCLHHNYWPMFTGSCTQYGLCDFHSVHALPHDIERYKLLEQDYMKDAWTHEDRDDEAATGA